MAEIGRNIIIANSKGATAREFNIGLAQNPYKRGSASWRAWRSGWCAEFRLENEQRRQFVREHTEAKS